MGICLSAGMHICMCLTHINCYTEVTRTIRIYPTKHSKRYILTCYNLSKLKLNVIILYRINAPLDFCTKIAKLSAVNISANSHQLYKLGLFNYQLYINQKSKAISGNAPL